MQREIDVKLKGRGNNLPNLANVNFLKVFLKLNMGFSYLFGFSVHVDLWPLNLPKIVLQD